MANMKKFSDMKDIGHLCAHYERSVQNDNYGNQDIDKSKLPLDHTNLAPDRGKQTDYIKAQIEKIMDGRTVRKDAVKMCCENVLLDSRCTGAITGREKKRVFSSNL